MSYLQWASKNERSSSAAQLRPPPTHRLPDSLIARGKPSLPLKPPSTDPPPDSYYPFHTATTPAILEGEIYSACQVDLAWQAE